MKHQPKPPANSQALTASYVLNPPHYRDKYVGSNGVRVEYKTGWARQHQLEGDGLLLLLYDHLCKSDKTKENRLKAAWIPDSVVFEHNFPRAWFTYDPKANEIVKKPGRDLDAATIFDVFGAEYAEGLDEKRPKSILGNKEIVAQFCYKSKSHQPTNQLSPARRRAGSPKRKTQADHQDIDETEERTSVEFFTQQTLKEFLTNTTFKPDGVLQKFLIPKGKPSSRHNFQLQAVWSPVVTLVYKRTTCKLLNERLASLEERAATFDGPPHYSSESLVAVSTERRIEGICNAIVRHFTETEHKPVVRAVFYFKEENKDRLWLLWASSLRFGGDALNPVHLRVPVRLAMKVHEAEKDDTIDSTIATGSNRFVAKKLLKKDVQMYNMTGDLSFARLCGGNMPRAVSARGPPRHEASITPAGTNEPSTAENGEGAPQSITTNNEQQQLQDEPKGPRQSSPTREGALTARSSPPLQLRYHRGGSAVHPFDRDSNHIIFSPRAPFLPRAVPFPYIDAKDERHPLHELYEAAEADEREHLNEIASHNKSRTVTKGSRHGTGIPDIAPSVRDDVLTEKALITPSTLEKLRRELKSLALDVLYEAYTAALGSATVIEEEVLVVFPPLIHRLLTLDDIDQLVQVMHLAPAETNAEGVPQYNVAAGQIGRGRRQDRPVAQLEREVIRFFDRLFEQTTDELQARYEEYLLTRPAE